MGQAISDITQPCCAGHCADLATETRVVEAPPGSYIVKLDRALDPKLGLDVEQVPEGAKLLIRGITGGLAEKWNVSNPDRKIKLGDSIIAVNGVSGNIPQMMQRCKADKVLQLTIKGQSAGQEQVVVTQVSAQEAAVEAAISASDGQFDPIPDSAPEPEMNLNQPSASSSGGSPTSQARIDPDVVENLAAMGFDQAAARDALQRAGGNFDEALAMLTSAGIGASGGGGGGDPAPGDIDAGALAQLTSMGFDEAQAADALRQHGGNLEQATQALLTAATGDGPPASGGDPPGVAQLTAMGFTREQAVNALDGAGGNVERATAILLGA